MPEESEKLTVQNNPDVFQVFHNVQFNQSQHSKYIKEMTKMYKKMSVEVFRRSFSNALHYLFTFGDTSANVDRVIQFVAKFCTSLDDEEEFLLFVFGIIFSCQSVAGQSVRYRASQLLAAVLTALGDEASLDDDLCDKLLVSQLERLQDTRGGVRCRAALALQRLQNPGDMDDPVTRAYLFHMSCDPSNSVRRAVVMSIAKCSRNLPHVLERLCDVDEAVRRAAFLYVAAINITRLKVRQRIHALKVGLNERSPRVRRVVEEILLPGWLGSFEGNIIDLLTAVRLDNIQGAKDSRTVAGTMLESLFKRLPVSELLLWLPIDPKLRLIPPEKLSKETMWYWRHLVLHLQKIDDDETLETVLPDLVVFCDYIRVVVETPVPDIALDPVGFSKRQYVLYELAAMLPVHDAADEPSRRALQKLIFDTLTGPQGPKSREVVSLFVKATEMVLPDPNKRIEFMGSVLSELLDRGETDPEVEAPKTSPMPAVESTETKLKRAQLRVSLNVALEEQEEAARAQDYGLAASCKARVDAIYHQIEELNTLHLQAEHQQQVTREETLPKDKVFDSEILNHCLFIVNVLLDTPQITHITPTLRMLFQEFEIELLRNPDDCIRENSLQTVALYAMLDEEFAKEHRPFFFAQLFDTRNEKLVSMALRCIVDILCVHGIRLFEDTSEGEKEGRGGEDRDDARRCKGKNRTALFDAGGAHSNAEETAEEVDSTIMSLSPSHATVIELLLRFTESENPEFRQIVVEGLCRLFTLGHLVSPTILSRLLLVWFNPATEEEDLLRQTLGVFFQTFATIVEGAREQIQAATIPTLKALAGAPVTSPLAEIEQEAVIRFIVSLTRTSGDEGPDIHGALAAELCSALTTAPASTTAPLLCRALALLAAPRDISLARDLAAAVDPLLEKLPDKQSCRNITRFQVCCQVSLEISRRTDIANSTANLTTDETRQTCGNQTNLRRISEESSDNQHPAEQITPEETRREPINTEQTEKIEDNSASVLPVPVLASLSNRPDAALDDGISTATPIRKSNGATLHIENARRSVRLTVSKPTSPPTKKSRSKKRQTHKEVQPEGPKVTEIDTTRSKRKVLVESDQSDSQDKQKSSKSSSTSRSSTTSQNSIPETLSKDSDEEDETIMHTINYDNEQPMLVLPESSDDDDVGDGDDDDKETSMPQEPTFIPETPETSDKSSSSSQEEPATRRSTRSRARRT